MLCLFIDVSQWCLLLANKYFGQIFGHKYLNGQNLVRQNFLHHAEIATNLSDFCLTFVLKYWTEFSKPSRNFDNLVRRIIVG